jgi:hypothetical protein
MPQVRDVGSTADGTRGVDVPTEQSIAKEEADAKRRAVEIFQEVAQKYTDKQNSDPEREEREKNASHMQGLLVENQELLQVRRRTPHACGRRVPTTRQSQSLLRTCASGTRRPNCQPGKL